MANASDIKGRMKAVGNIKRITKTMQMIATARYQSAMRRVTTSQPYAKKIRELVGELATALAGDPRNSQEDAASQVSHPLLSSQPQATRRLLLVLTSNRGLCGGYNGNVLRMAHRYIRELADEGVEYDLQVVGKKGVSYCRFNGITVDRVLSDFSEAPTYEQVERVADQYMQQFTAGTYDRVDVLFMAFETMGRQRPVINQLLPLEPPSSDEHSRHLGSHADYDFSPEPRVLLEELLPATVKIQLYQWFNEAVLSEHIARMVAMKNATDAATKMRKSLTRQYNRARQTAITTELSEIIGGAAALE